MIKRIILFRKFAQFKNNPYLCGSKRIVNNQNTAQITRKNEPRRAFFEPEKVLIMDTNRDILQFLHYHPLSSRAEITDGLAFLGSDATMKRLLAYEVQQGNIMVSGTGRATRYSLSNQAQLCMPINLDTYFAQDVDERKVQTCFNFD